ncbi:MAG: catalase [Psychromonas sp.]|nr:catalase [Alteromonadales bacterium]MCP5079424.1 catalase [Psychromonas sp.]
MNISATHLPIQHTVTPQHVGDSFSPKVNSSASIETSVTVHDTTISPSTDSVVNPTYEKPVVTVFPDEAEKDVKQSGDQIDPHEEQTSTTEPSDVEPENGEVYSESELELISSLKHRDAEVNAHEKAHAAVGGQHAGSPSYSYKTGPDGVKYAVSGEVSIDTSRVPGDPQATLQKAQQIKAAALAPVDPSGQDRKVAAKADQMATQARSEILEENGSGEKSSKRSPSQIENSVPEHFTGAQNLSIANNSDSNIQAEMSERSFHINALYQGSSSTITSPSFEAIA